MYSTNSQIKLNPKTAGWGQFVSKNLSSNVRVKSYVFVTFDITINHIFPENVIEIPQFV